MKRCPQFTHLLVFPRLRVQNANAISSPLTHGFPAMTAFLGLLWALERKADGAGFGNLAFNAVGVISHGWQELTTDRGFVKSFRLTRNPLHTRNHRKRIDKHGNTSVPAIVEKGRIHLDLSLVFALYAEDWDAARRQQDIRVIADLVFGMRIAGGTVTTTHRPASRRHSPWLIDMTGDGADQCTEFHNMCRQLLPGSALVARDDLLDRRLHDLRTVNADATPLDAWLSLSRVDWHFDPEIDNDDGGWRSSRKRGDGWIVPIPVGYAALSDLHPGGSVRDARDQTTPFRFVESLYSVGEWIGAHRLRSARDLLWWVDKQPDEGLYRCRNDYRPLAAEPALF